MTKAAAKKKQTREQREANEYRRSMVEDSTIVHMGNGFNYDPIERRFFSPNWEVMLNTYDYLRELMDEDPERFEGCQIVKQTES
jgi:hypothetical protein